MIQIDLGTGGMYLLISYLTKLESISRIDEGYIPLTCDKQKNFMIGIIYKVQKAVNIHKNIEIRKSLKNILMKTHIFSLEFLNNIRFMIFTRSQKKFLKIDILCESP